MALDALRSWWAEPRPADAPGPGRRDWALVTALSVWSVLELVLRDGLSPLPMVVLVAVAVVVPLPWRRTEPFVAAVVTFGAATLVDVARITVDADGTLLNSTVATLLVAYALFRWGSGREAVGGAVLIVAWLSVTNVADRTNLADSIGAYGFFLFATSLGAAIRYRARVRVRDIDEAKARERELLARELHDTVAHHVSGIAIQAQAGRAVAAAHPERAAEALATIEDAATRTLTELRTIVGVLRSPQDAELAPRSGIAEVELLATDDGTSPRVQVALHGELDDLSPGVGAALFRLAQESVTNARRHSRDATVVSVVLTGDADHVRLTVDDDGSTAGHAPPGYGLVGMQERASLLGGTFHAGPADRGWRVEAVLPRTGAPR